MAREITVTSSERLRASVQVGGHHVAADVSPERGGEDTAPSPGELLLSAVGTCKVITVRAFAARRQWPLEGVEARLTLGHADGRIASIDVEMVLKGPLDDAQRQKLYEVAKACPVSRAIAAGVAVTLH